MRHWYSSLAVRSMLAQLLGLAVVLSVVGAFQFRSIRQNVHAEAARVGETVAALFSEQLSDEPHRFDAAVLEPMADRLAGKLVSVSRIRFTDAEGRLIADSAAASSGTSQTGEGGSTRKDTTEIVRPIFGRYDPVRRSRRIGTITVEIDFTLANRRVQRGLVQSIALLLALVPVYWLIEYLVLGRSTLRRLRLASEAASALSAGDYSARTGLTKSDEIGQVGAAFDEMASRLGAAHERMAEEMAERSAVEVRIRELNQELEGSMAAVTRQNQAINTLNDLSKVMQACTTVDEALEVIPRYAASLLDGAGGGVYVLHASRDHLELASELGSRDRLEPFFNPEKCWGFRLGKLHVSHTESTTVCAHLHDLQPGWEYHCAPLHAHSDALGLLQVQFESASSGGVGDPARDLRLVALAEQLGIALGNLRLRETLRQQSIKDPLTHLFNRRYLEETLEREIERSRRMDSPLVAMMLDVDHFKRFNDTYGHDAGDHVLVLLGRLIAHSTRAGDIACRYGGEEFVLILPSASQAEGLERAEELRKAVAALDLDFMGRHMGNFSISIGVAALTPKVRVGSELLRKADELLFQAKANGRNQVVGASDS